MTATPDQVKAWKKWKTVHDARYALEMAVVAYQKAPTNRRAKQLTIAQNMFTTEITRRVSK